MILELTRETAGQVVTALGKRPGKTVDADYLRKSPFAGKYMFWSEEDGKYISPVRYGTRFELIEGQPPRILRG